MELSICKTQTISVTLFEKCENIGLKMDIAETAMRIPSGVVLIKGLEPDIVIIILKHLIGQILNSKHAIGQISNQPITCLTQEILCKQHPSAVLINLFESEIDFDLRHFLRTVF